MKNFLIAIILLALLLIRFPVRENMLSKTNAGLRQDSSQPQHNCLVRVVTVSQDGLNEKPGKPRLEATITRLNRAAAFQPDIVCLPETLTKGKPEVVPGPTTKRLSKWARENSCYVVCPITTRSEGKIFNSAILIDRQGKILGKYNKIHPTEGELDNSICPGKIDPPVFQTDFGKIGIQICFDVNWHAQWRRLKEKGADIIFFPSAYPAARQVKTLAWLNQCFIVSSTQTRASSIFDISGEIIETTGKYRRWAGAVLPLGKKLFEIDFHISKMRKIEQKYGPKVSIQWYHDDDLVSLASLDPELTVADLIDEFKLTPHPAYIQRAQNAQDKRRPVQASPNQ
ncbi:MAG: carbon-nitrogen hydrolase family protein [Planctomycetes bacterium]|nr:carbon-nitrogen hydrolase family protein [Planctomycetota bacterium]